MALMGRKTQDTPIATLPRLERIAAHQRAAEDLLARAGKAGRLEAETRLATMATAHATLAVSYQMSTD